MYVIIAFSACVLVFYSPGVTLFHARAQELDDAESIGNANYHMRQDLMDLLIVRAHVEESSVKIYLEKLISDEIDSPVQLVQRMAQDPIYLSRLDFDPLDIEKITLAALGKQSFVHRIGGDEVRDEFVFGRIMLGGFETTFAIEDLEKNNVVEVYNHICLTGADDSSAQKSNGIVANDSDEPEIAGTTIWINEWMAPGHLEYDVQFLQILHTTPVDRIIIQRAPCARSDFCRGVTYWGSYFEGLVACAIASAGLNIPVFFRLHHKERHWLPFFLVNVEGSRVIKSRGDTSWPSDIPKLPPLIWKNTTLTIRPPSPNPDLPGIEVQDKMCFQRLIRRTSITEQCEKCIMQSCHTCFAFGMSKTVVRRFKEAVYSLLAPANSPIAVVRSPSLHPVIITIAHRFGHNRAMSHPNELRDSLQNQLGADTAIVAAVDVRLYDTTNTSASYLVQMRLMAESDVVICTHGSFVGNLVYMRDEALLIELIGNYGNTVNDFAFELLARTFSVYRVTVTMSDLQEHSQDQYDIQENEVETIRRVISVFLRQNNKTINDIQ